MGKSDKKIGKEMCSNAIHEKDHDIDNERPNGIQRMTDERIIGP